MVIVWLFAVGIGCLGLFGYFGLKYANVPSKYDFELHLKWLDDYHIKHPDAADEYTEKWLKEHPNAAPTDSPLKEEYLKRIIWGKRSIVIFVTVGGILTAISSVF